MEHDPASPPAVPAHAPPTVPTAPLAAHRSSWPKVLGILCCVFAGVGLLMRLFQTAGVFAMQHLPIDAWMKPPAHLTAALIALSIAGLLITVVHMALGVQLLRRRPSALALAIAFLVIVVLLHIPNSIVQWQVQQAQMQGMQQQMAQQSQGGAPPPAMPVLGPGFGLAMGVIGGLFAIAWPTFLIVWLVLPGHRRELRDGVRANA